MNELTIFEKSVMAKLLCGSHPLLENLRNQLAQCRISSREHTEVGFFVNFDVETKLSYSDVNLEIGDVDAKIDGVQHGVGFVLFIRQGRLSMLEGYTYGEPYPKDITQYTLSYDTGDERNVTALFNKLQSAQK